MPYQFICTDLSALSPIGLLALANLPTIAKRVAIAGNASYLDILILCPGIQLELDAPELAKGEIPACAAMVTPWVGRAGQLTFLEIEGMQEDTDTGKRGAEGLGKHGGTGHVRPKMARKTATGWSGTQGNGFISDILHDIICPALSISAILRLAYLEDWNALGACGALMAARAMNVLVIKRRARSGAEWKGEPEPGVWGALFVLLSQDKWVILEGLVDHLKATASGYWLGEASALDQTLTTIAKMLVYLAPALLFASKPEGALIFLALLSITTACLALSNTLATNITMHGHRIRESFQPIRYKRRLHLLNDPLIQFYCNEEELRTGNGQIAVAERSSPKEEAQKDEDVKGKRPSWMFQMGMELSSKSALYTQPDLVIM
ncbi:hypothetical protein BJ508DRAFT_327798 [Ascobolus immersus RN42]|uniref:Uncharacterized protein n=1 Tax=Ascobolus immersus RN42 TaxID=1160509 RepID=A0A3N4I700_ASCIM|nr:hypothetical protein BJ508DRAFT_327798 [Ascobolus immersus RN42]